MKPTKAKKAGKAYSVPAIHRALDLIEALASEKRAFTVTEVSRKFRIPKSSAYAILQTLKSRGYLQKNGDDKYSLTLKIHGLGNALIDSLDWRQKIYPLLKQLTEKSRITGHLAVLDQGYAVYIEKVEVMGAIRLTTWIGKRMHLHSTSIGKALIAHLPEEDIAQMIAERGLPRLTSRTLIDPRHLKRELAQVRSQGYALANEENEEGVRAVAAPIFNHSGQVVAAVNLGGSTLQIKMKDIPELGSLVRAHAQQMSRQLGWTGRLED